MDSRKKKGIVLLMLPWGLLALSMVLQIIGRLAGVDGALQRIINLTTVLLGMVAVVGMVPFIISGIVLLSKSDKKDAVEGFSDQPVNTNANTNMHQDQNSDQLPPNSPTSV